MPFKRISNEDWRAAVGDEIAENSTPSHTEVDGTLVVATRDPIWAFELTQREADIRARLPGIRRIRFTAKRDFEALKTTKPKTRREEYADYLQSDHWRSLRQWALERANYRCQVCNTSELTLHVHHRTYDNVGAELPGDLIVLCAQCHQTFHDRGHIA